MEKVNRLFLCVAVSFLIMDLKTTHSAQIHNQSGIITISSFSLRPISAKEKETGFVANVIQWIKNRARPGIDRRSEIEPLEQRLAADSYGAGTVLVGPVVPGIEEFPSPVAMASSDFQIRQTINAQYDVYDVTLDAQGNLLGINLSAEGELAEVLAADVAKAQAGITQTPPVTKQVQSDGTVVYTIPDIGRSITLATNAQGNLTVATRDTKLDKAIGMDELVSFRGTIDEATQLLISPDGSRAVVVLSTDPGYGRDVSSWADVHIYDLTTGAKVKNIKEAETGDQSVSRTWGQTWVTNDGYLVMVNKGEPFKATGIGRGPSNLWVYKLSDGSKVTQLGVEPRSSVSGFDQNANRLDTALYSTAWNGRVESYRVSYKITADGAVEKVHDDRPYAAQAKKDLLEQRQKAEMPASFESLTFIDTGYTVKLAWKNLTTDKFEFYVLNYDKTGKLLEITQTPFTPTEYDRLIEGAAGGKQLVIQRGDKYNFVIDIMAGTQSLAEFSPDNIALPKFMSVTQEVQTMWNMDRSRAVVIIRNEMNQGHNAAEVMLVNFDNNTITTLIHSVLEAGTTDTVLGQVWLDGDQIITANRGAWFPSEYTFWLSRSFITVFDIETGALLEQNDLRATVHGATYDPTGNMVTVYSTIDPNGDGILAPMDALVVINALNEHGTMTSSNPAWDPKLDVNKDGYITPIDLLIVTNALNAGQKTLEGPIARYIIMPDGSIKEATTETKEVKHWPYLMGSSGARYAGWLSGEGEMDAAAKTRITDIALTELLKQHRELDPAKVEVVDVTRNPNGNVIATFGAVINNRPVNGVFDLATEEALQGQI